MMEAKQLAPYFVAQPGWYASQGSNDDSPLPIAAFVLNGGNWIPIVPQPGGILQAMRGFPRILYIPEKR